MSQKDMLKIQNKGAILQVLGCIINNPTLLMNGEYKISPDDFPEKLHKIIFSAVNNLVFDNDRGTSIIDIPALCNFFEPMPTQNKTFIENNGVEFVEAVMEVARQENFNSNYKQLKKFSVLRDLYSNGIDISDTYDIDETDPIIIEAQEKRIFNTQVEDIINHYMAKFNDIANKHEMESIGVSKIMGGDRVRDIIARFKLAPEIGMMFYNEFYNTAFRGARLSKFYLETASSGCVDRDTEFFTGTGWKKISEYKEGDLVLQYNMENQEATLTKPERYIKTHCEEFNYIHTMYGLDQMICDEHNMVFKNTSRNAKIVKIPFTEFKERHNGSKEGTSLTIPTAFYKTSGKGIDITEADLRVMIAVMADGSFRADCRPTWCRINVKKQRKKDRLTLLLNEANIPFESRDKQDGYTVYKFDAPLPIKHFPIEWYEADVEQMKIIIDEVVKWDGSVKEGKRKRYFTSSASDADYIQFIASSLGIRSSLTIKDRTGQVYKTGDKEYIRKSIDYVVSFSSHSCFVSMSNPKGEKVKIERVPSPDGFKYCFTVETGALVLRRNGKVFITGNCGKSRRMIRESVFMSIPYLYNIETCQWEHTGIVPVSTTYINTELEENEILPIAIAFLSGVDEEKIKLNTCSEEEWKRVDQAVALMEKYNNWHIVMISDFDVDDIERIILDKILKHDCKYFYFDYIHSTAKSLSLYYKKTGVGLQEYQVLFLMAVELKAICQKYKVFLWSATQISGSTMGEEIRDERALRGSKAMADKVDAGNVLTRVSEVDLDKLKEILATRFGETPTHCLSVYKNRGGRIRGVFLWSKFNLGTMREEFLFATNDRYEPIAFTFLDFELAEEDMPTEEEMDNILMEDKGEITKEDEELFKELHSTPVATTNIDDWF